MKTTETAIGTQEPPQDYRIFNRRQKDGTFRPLAEFFERKVSSAQEVKA